MERRALSIPASLTGGAHLSDTNYPTGDIVRRLGTACAAGGIVALILSGIIIAIYSLLAKRIFPNTQTSENGYLSKRAVITISLLAFSITFLIMFIVTFSPSYHILGTDKVGYDVFYRSLKSIRTGLVIGSVTTLIVTPFAIIFGVLAGYWGGLLDDIIQYIYSTLASIPSVLLIVSFMLLVEIGESVDDIAWRADRRLLSLCIIMGITSWTGLCRLIRGETLKLRELDYVQAALSFGVSRLRIIAQHIVPNLMHFVLISFILRFSGLVLAEAVLAYIGIGVDPSMESWGNMINTARLELAREPVVWWNLFAAFIFMFGLVLPANLFGDALRDALDPRLKTYFHTAEGIAKSVDGISFEIQKGETFALVGESGCGKSITALSIMRLIQQPAGFHAGGEIRFSGTNLTRLPEPEMRRLRGKVIF